MTCQCIDVNKKQFSMRLSLKRIEKLRLYAQQKDKTMTQLVEEWIDRLKIKEETRG